MLIDLLNKIKYFYFTYFSFFVYGLKVVCDQIIAVLLGVLLVVQNIEGNVMKIMYIVCAIIIIIMIMLDKVLRSNSKTFDLLATLTGPINIGVQMIKVVDYSWKTHSAQVFILFLIEVIKILCSTYCIIVINLQNFIDPYFNYIVFGILLFNSATAALLYFSYFLAILIIRDFYYKWLKWFTTWYLKCVINVEIEKQATLLTVKFAKLQRCEV